MSTTEAKAGEKWCPFARVLSVTSRQGEEKPIGLAAINRGYGETVNCIASKCMAWRWTPPSVAEPVRRGFCGLAGLPDYDR